MAVQFGSNERGFIKSFVEAPTSYPFSMAIWFKDQALVGWDLCSVGDSQDNKNYLVLSGLNNPPDTLRLRIIDNASGVTNIDSGGTFTNTNWNHGAVNIVSDADRSVWLNGVETNNTTALTYVEGGHDSFALGSRANNEAAKDLQSMSGSMAEFGLWNVSLTDGEFISLANGMSPIMIRPESLVSYMPLHGRFGRD